MGQKSRTAQLAVVAAALALAGIVLAAWARFAAVRVVDGTHAEAAAVAERLGGMLSTAVGTARIRAAGLAAMPSVRAAIETDLATVRDMARAEGFIFQPAPGETLEFFQVARDQAPVSLLRAPESARPIRLQRVDEVRLALDDGALVVTVAAPSEPLYAHGRLKGAVAVATRVDLAPLFAASAEDNLAAELVGLGDAVPLSSAPVTEGARVVTAAVPFSADRNAPPLVVRAAVHAGGGATLWSGRVLLVGALLVALFALVEHRRRKEPIAPPAARPAATVAKLAMGSAPIDLNAPTNLMPALPTAREKRVDADRHLVLAWSAAMPTPITQLKPAQESLPIVVDSRGDDVAGRFRLLSPLGRGAVADVYLAQSFVAGAPGTVALKMVAGGTPDERARYLDAARRQMRVNHPNVAQVHDVASDEFAYVAMEYVEGCTLEQLLREIASAGGEPLPLPQSVAIVRAVCRALEAAQEARDDRGARRPLVHGSVKPSNVLVGRHNVIKLADFGAPASPTDRHAPEQYAGRSADRRSDVYAVGLLLHELCTGRRVELPPGDTRQWPPLPAPSSLRPELPRELDLVVAKATRFGPRGRYATAGELLFELERATADAAHAYSATVLGDWVDRARHS